MWLESPKATRKPSLFRFLHISVLALCCHLFVSSSAPSPQVQLKSIHSNDQNQSVALGFAEAESVGSNETCHSPPEYIQTKEMRTKSATVSPELTLRAGQQTEPPSLHIPQVPTDLTIEKEKEILVDDDDDDAYFEDDEEDSLLSFEAETKLRDRFLKRQKIKFLNRIAEVSSNLLQKEQDAIFDNERSSKSKSDRPYYTTGLEYDDSEEDDDRITEQSDLTRPGRFIHIVTTAALPWMTGTAVNPLLRAAYLHDRLETINDAANTTRTESNRKSFVTLVIPWLELPEDQQQVYNGRVFESKNDQEKFVREWLAESANMKNAAENLKIVFYNARYHAPFGSVFAMGDILRELPSDELDVCVLEEPEHLNWFRAPSMESWTKRYNYVVGIVHTNYEQYVSQHYSGLWTGPAIRLMSAAMVRAYCHKVIKLSAVVQDFAPEKEVTSNVHGVRTEFIATIPTVTKVEDENATSTDPSQNHYVHDFSKPTQIYFIGKLLWTKGLDILLEYQEYYKEIVGDYFPIDIYGSGPDQSEIARAYLGRQKKISRKTKKRESDKRPKNRFVRAFSWMKKQNRKGNKKTKQKGANVKGNHTDDGNITMSKSIVTVDDIYNEVMDVMESLPLKARESIDGLKESLDQLSEDVTKVQETFKRLPDKVRKALNQLIDDLSLKATNFPIPRSLYEFRRQSIPATFPGRVDHAILKGNITHPSFYTVFVNPSVSEVLCTATAEALAMGKFAIIPVHSSNAFFLQFPNCLGYRNPYEFVANLRWALTHDPVPHTADIARAFTWDAATDRFLEASGITHREARERELLGRSKIDERIAWLHIEMGKGIKGDLLRKALGGGPASGQVKYEMTRRTKGSNSTAVDDLNEDDELEMDGEGLPRKFRNSVFVRSIREAIENGLTTTID